MTQPAVQPAAHVCDAERPALQPAAREARNISLEDAAAGGTASCASQNRRASCYAGQVMRLRSGQQRTTSSSTFSTKTSAPHLLFLFIHLFIFIFLFIYLFFSFYFIFFFLFTFKNFDILSEMLNMMMLSHIVSKM